MSKIPKGIDEIVLGNIGSENFPHNHEHNHTKV